MNNVTLIGRLTKDIVLNQTQNKKVYARFVLAVDDKMSKDKKADFITCLAWEKKAEILEKYTKRGSKLGIQGRIQTGSYDGKNGKVYTTEILCNEIELLDSKPQAESYLDNNTVDIQSDDLPF